MKFIHETDMRFSFFDCISTFVDYLKPKLSLLKDSSDTI